MILGYAWWQWLLAVVVILIASALLEALIKYLIRKRFRMLTKYPQPVKPEPKPLLFKVQKEENDAG